MITRGIDSVSGRQETKSAAAEFAHSDIRHSEHLRHGLDDDYMRRDCYNCCNGARPSVRPALMSSTSSNILVDGGLDPQQGQTLGQSHSVSDSFVGGLNEIAESDDEDAYDDRSPHAACFHNACLSAASPRGAETRLCGCSLGSASSLQPQHRQDSNHGDLPQRDIPQPTSRLGGSRWPTLLWRGAARASVAVLVMWSCLGVNLAHPASPPGPYPPPPGAAAATPMRLSESERHYRLTQSKAMKYLAQFGYLTGPSRETGYLMSMDDLSKAIKSLQSLAGIPQTGVVDQRTEELMQKPRCGNVDSTLGVIPGQGRLDLGQDTWPVGAGRRRRRKRYTEAPSKWSRTNLTFRLINYTGDMSRAKTREIIRDAFTLWSNSTSLEFSEVTSGDADIMIQFASRYHQDGYPFDGRGMILAHAFFPGPGRGGDTHFDDDETWTLNSTDGVDLFMVAAHEFGHALGLAHSADPGALMYPWYQGFSGKFVLPRDDMEGIQKLYGPPSGEKDLWDSPKVSLNPGNDNDDDGATGTKDVIPKSPGGGDDRSPPDPCTTPIDAIAVIRSDIFIFIGQYFWRMSNKMQKEKGSPTHIHQFWYNLPPTVKKIDAAWERLSDRKILFFSGNRYWEYNSNHLVNQFPKEGLPITEFGIPADVKHIDAIFTWGFNKRTYFVSGDMYWKLDENNTRVEYDYPRDMSIWRGVPVPLDAAFKYWDEKTYFFKGKSYWKFYDLKMRVENSYPRSIAEDWLNCFDAQSQVQKQSVQQHSLTSSSCSYHYGNWWLVLTLLCVSVLSVIMRA